MAGCGTRLGTLVGRVLDPPGLAEAQQRARRDRSSGWAASECAWAALVLGPVLALLALPLAPLVGLAPRERWDTGTKTDMVVYFRPDTPDEDVLRFWTEVLSVPTTGERGG